MAELVDTPEPSVVGDAPAECLNLSSAEAFALGASPSLASLEARIRAARWEGLQAGLPPNPTVGYLASEVGNEGDAGQQGAYMSQRLVRGGKLGYARAVAGREARNLEQEYAVERLRLLTDTRTAFYDCFLSQVEVELSGRLTELSANAAETTRRLLEAGEGRRTDALQAEIENRRASAVNGRATQRLHADWRRLAALTGYHAEDPRELEAKFEDLIEELDWEETELRVMRTSPELASRMAAIDKARAEIAYQESLAVPDVTAQLSVQYDDATDDTVAGVQIGAPLLLWNRNQGGIGRARAGLTAARRSLEATEQRIERRLAEVFGRYQAARVQATALRDEVLPRAQESLELATEGFEAGEISFLDLLTVQRTYFRVNLESLEALRELNATGQLMRGCLLSESGGVAGDSQME